MPASSPPAISATTAPIKANGSVIFTPRPNSFAALGNDTRKKCLRRLEDIDDAKSRRPTDTFANPAYVLITIGKKQAVSAKAIFDAIPTFKKSDTIGTIAIIGVDLIDTKIGRSTRRNDLLS